MLVSSSGVAMPPCSSARLTPSWRARSRCRFSAEPVEGLSTSWTPERARIFWYCKPKAW
jgi:hypothetical protein